MAPIVTKEAGYALKGQQDASWAICPNCQGLGQISQELAIGGATGVKGDTCSVCNGVGRVPDPSWPACGCGGEELCPACSGLGLLSPQAQKTLRDRIRAAQAASDDTAGHLRALKRAVPRGGYGPEPPQA
jgi:DnaJ-class molecular chaperone